MAGLAKICKMYGSMKVNGAEWVYDYAKDKAVLKSEMNDECLKKAKNLNGKCRQ